jgi:hypothetical protein
MRDAWWPLRAENVVSDPRLRVLTLVAVGAVVLGGSTCDRVRRVAQPSKAGAPAVFVMPTRPVCEASVGEVVDVAAVDGDLREVSGLASSLATPGLLWMINDAGNDPVVFGVSAEDGVTRLLVTLPVDNVDFEDVAVGPCPDLSGPCVFVADTGNNEATRDVVFVHAFPEPTLFTLKPAEGTNAAKVTLDAVWTMPLTFPDGDTPDVEALAVLPDATAMLLFEKVEADSARIFAYRAPWTPLTPNDGIDNDSPRVVELTGTVTVPASVGDSEARRITAADMHWSGTRLLLRTTGAILEYSAEDASGFFDIGERQPRQQVISPVDEVQGEAVTHTEAGPGWLTISEVKAKRAKAGETPVLHRFDCTP